MIRVPFTGILPGVRDFLTNSFSTVLKVQSINPRVMAVFPYPTWSARTPPRMWTGRWVRPSARHPSGSRMASEVSSSNDVHTRQLGRDPLRQQPFFRSEPSVTLAPLERIARSLDDLQKHQYSAMIEACRLRVEYVQGAMQAP